MNEDLLLDAKNTLKMQLSLSLSIPNEEWQLFQSKLYLISLKKGQFFFEQGQEVRELGFVLRGLLYNFYLNEDGDTYVKYFIEPGKIVTCYSALITNSKASFSCQTLEDTNILALKVSDLQNFYERHIVWQKMGRLFAERYFVEKEERERTFLMMDARKRYEKFLQHQPDLAKKIPQHLIASFLGITPVSLSRLKKS